MLSTLQTVNDSEINNYNNILINRTLAYRKAKHFPYSWWKQAIYTELVDSENSSAS